jgi:hypothetical protein
MISLFPGSVESLEKERSKQPGIIRAANIEPDTCFRERYGYFARARGYGIRYRTVVSTEMQGKQGRAYRLYIKVFATLNCVITD